VILIIDNRMWPKLGKMLVSMANISSHKNQTFESFPKLFVERELFPRQREADDWVWPEMCCKI